MNSKHSDVTFVVGSTKIPAHKTILSARSEYFQNLLFGNFNEANQNEINLEVPLDAFKIILRFLYTGRMSLLSLDVNQIIDIYKLIDFYNIEPLKETIPKYLTSKLSLENWFAIHNAACLYSSDDLQKSCLTFIECHSIELIKSDNFKLISPALLCTLLKRDTFYAPEIDIFIAVKNWSLNKSTTDSKVKYFPFQ